MNTTESAHHTHVIVVGGAALLAQAKEALPRSRFRVDGGELRQLAQAEVVVLALDAVALGPAVAAVRKSARSSTYVVAVVDEADIAAAVAADVDDFVRAPLSSAEFLARIEGLRDHPRAAPLSMLWDDAFPALHNFPQTFLDTMVGFSGQDFQADLTDATPASDAVVSRVTLNMVGDGIAVNVWLLLEPSSVQAFASSLLGVDSSPPEVLDDLTKELANLVGGTLKRTCATTSYVTLGLPRQLTFNSFASVAPQLTTRVTSVDGRINVLCAVEMTRKETSLVLLDELREGMILAADTRDASGNLLLTAGTRLTTQSAKKLHEHLEAVRRICVVE